jgi:hypothetical protein
MATSDSIQGHIRSTSAWPALLAAGVAAFLLAILAPAIKWLVVYIFKDV